MPKSTAQINVDKEVLPRPERVNLALMYCRIEASGRLLISDTNFANFPDEIKDNPI